MTTTHRESVTSNEADTWWLSTSNIRALLLWMVDHDLVNDTVKDACEVLSTPWSWTPEWERMQRGDSVDDDDHEGLEPTLERSIAVAKARKATANDGGAR